MRRHQNLCPSPWRPASEPAQSSSIKGEPVRSDGALNAPPLFGVRHSTSRGYGSTDGGQHSVWSAPHRSSHNLVNAPSWSGDEGVPPPRIVGTRLKHVSAACLRVVPNGILFPTGHLMVLEAPHAFISDPWGLSRTYGKQIAPHFFPTLTQHQIFLRRFIDSVIDGLEASTIATVWAINNLGQVVGRLNAPVSPTGWHANRYCEGVLTDLNSLLPGGSGWEVVDASSINDKGEIIGEGLIFTAPMGLRPVIMKPRSAGFAGDPC